MLKMRLKHAFNFIQAALLSLASTFLNRTIQSRKLALHCHIKLKVNDMNKVWWKCSCFELLGTDRHVLYTPTWKV